MVTTKKNVNKLKKRLTKNYLSWKIFVGVIALLFLFLFLQIRDTKIDIPQLNSTANKYVISALDFDFYDEEENLLIKQNAIQDIGNVYQIDFDKMKNNLKGKENKIFNNDKTSHASSAIEEILKEIKFSDENTIRKLQNYNDFGRYFLKVNNSEFDAQKIFLKDYFYNIKKFVKDRFDNLSDDSTNFAIQNFINYEVPLKKDLKTKKLLHDKIIKSLPKKYTRIREGTKIIDKNERVTTRHISMLQAMKDALMSNQNIWSWDKITGNFILSLVLIIISAIYLFFENKTVFRSIQKLSLLVSIFIITLCLSKLIELLVVKNSADFIEFSKYPLIVPFAAILISILINSKVALYIVSFLTILLGVSLTVDNSRFLIINFFSSLIVITSAKSLRKRKQVFKVFGKSLFAVIPLVISFYFVTSQFWTYNLLIDIAMSIGFIIATAILAVGLLPIFETLFNIMTDITLVEYMDPNNEILRRLTLEVPGTYQHSLILGNLAESAAQAIGANALLCKVATLYHDIGKLNNAHYFTENQQSGVNIHQLLTPTESAHVIISHIKDGEMIAKKNRLPQAFIDIIKEHHGTTLVYYFYCKEVELKGGNLDEVDESKFRYPGPKPHSKEAAIIMIADAVEATSRSLDELSEDTLKEMVDRVVDDKAEDGQFDECELTFKELGIVKEALIKTLMITGHVRVKYPEKVK